MHFQYMLRCADGSLYIGETDNLDERVARHQVVLARGDRDTERLLRFPQVKMRRCGIGGDELRQEVSGEALDYAEFCRRGDPPCVARHGWCQQCVAQEIRVPDVWDLDRHTLPPPFAHLGK